jgi:two-component system, response regulator PdtaR
MAPQTQPFDGWPLTIRPVLSPDLGGLESDEEQRKRILIVEDDYFTATSYHHALEAAGFAVVGIASTYEEALAICSQELPDLVIMDVRLSSAKDGIDAAIDIRALHDIPAIFVSAFTDPATRKRIEGAMAMGVLAKPIRIEHLVRYVAEALDRQKKPE